MHQEQSEINDLSSRADDLSTAGHDPAWAEGAMQEQQGTAAHPGEQANPPDAADQLESLSPPQGEPSYEDNVLIVETIAFPDAADLASSIELAAAAEPASSAEVWFAMPEGETRLPWYRTRWFSIGAGVLASALLGVGAALVIRQMQRRRHQRFSLRSLKSLQAAAQRLSLPPLRQVTTRSQQQINHLTNQSGTALSARTHELQDSLSRLTNRARAQQEPLARWMRDQASQLNTQTRALSARTVEQLQQGLSAARESVAAGASTTGTTLKHGWRSGRSLAFGVGVGALWASLFTPHSGQATRAHLADLFQRRQRPAE